jgi:hypothetical protein
VWEGWKAGSMAFRAFHTPAFPRLVLGRVWVATEGLFQHRESTLNVEGSCEKGSLKSILGPEHMKARCLIPGVVLAALALAAPALWAQDGLGGAIARLGTTRGFLHEPFEQRLAAADFDKDQKPDGAVLVDTGQFDGQKTFRIELHVSAGNDSDLTFESNDLAPAISTLDVNQDGAPDIVVEEAFTHKRLYVWLNDGHGTFRKARTEDFPSTGRDGPYEFNAPSLAQDCPALYLPSKLGSELSIARAAAPSLDSCASGQQVRPITSAAQTRADEPNPSRGPPSLPSL